MSSILAWSSFAIFAAASFWKPTVLHLWNSGSADRASFWFDVVCPGLG